MFDTDGYEETATCCDCGKERECVVTRCKLGTFHGPICAKCFFKEARKRKSAKSVQAVAKPAMAVPAGNAIAVK